ncbi:MAG: alpha/beta hydrolase [Woeseiaceae bacterium]|nr:alpha/beta hydrolase [Woeseiaceae bacterium]
MTNPDDKKTAKISKRARFIRAIVAWYLDRIDARTADVLVTRKRFDKMAGKLRPAKNVEIKSDTVADLPAEWLTPAGAADDSLMLYWHGGAYLMGSCQSHRAMVSHIAKAAGVRALVPEYRLAPEHRFPAALDDAVKLYRQLIADGVKPEKIVVAGDSAGGNLTVAMLLALRHAGDPMPKATVLLSPWLDLGATGETMVTRKDQDPLFDPAELPHVVERFCDDDKLKNPIVSPVYANVAGLPETLIQVGDDEILLSDSVRFAENIRAAGGKVHLDVWPGMWHVWQMFGGLIPEARRGTDKLGKFIREKLAA